MPKRFTDSNKWQDVWFMELKPDYKMLWFYLLDTCDHAGIWKVNLKLASFHIGYDFTIENIKLVMADRINFFSDEYWQLVKFIDFQYGGIKNDAVGKSVQKILKRHNLVGATEGLHSPIVATKDKDKVKAKAKDYSIDGKNSDLLNINDWQNWGDQIVNDNDFVWEQMRGRKISRSQMDEFISIATRNDWKMPTQQSFRVSINGFQSKSKTDKPKFDPYSMKSI